MNLKTSITVLFFPFLLTAQNEVIKKRERIGRNPKTKEEAKISSRKIIKFKPSTIFKNKINNND